MPVKATLTSYSAHLKVIVVDVKGCDTVLLQLNGNPDEEPLTYDKFLAVYRQKEQERSSHFKARKHKWAGQELDQSVRVCLI